VCLGSRRVCLERRVQDRVPIKQAEAATCSGQLVKPYLSNRRGALQLHCNYFTLVSRGSAALWPATLWRGRADHLQHSGVEGRCVLMLRRCWVRAVRQTWRGRTRGVALRGRWGTLGWTSYSEAGAFPVR